MKKAVFLFIVFIAFRGFAQKINIEVGEPFPISESSSMLTTGYMGGKIFVLEKEDNNIYLNVYNPSNLKLITTKTITQNNCIGTKDSLTHDLLYNHTIFMKNNMIILFNSFDKSSKENTLFAQKIDTSGIFDGTLTTIDKKISDDKRKIEKFITAQSEDSTKFLIIQAPSYKEYQGEKYTFKVYDSNLHNISNYCLPLPYKENDISVINYYLGNDGTIYMLVKVTKEKKDREKEDARSFYSILSLKEKGDAFTEYPINFPKKDIETIALKLDNKSNQILCSGLYSDIAEDGMFYLKVDEVKEKIISKSFNVIDISVLDKMLNETKSKFALGPSSLTNSKNFKIMDIIPMKDSSTKIITEYRYIRENRMKSGNSYEITYSIFRKNIFIITIDKNGHISSLVNIPKNEGYGYADNKDDLVSSTLLMNDDDRFAFIFNDNPQNYTASKKVKMIRYLLKSFLVAVVLNNDGTYTKQKLYDNLTEKKIQFYPGDGIKIAKGQYIIPVCFPFKTDLSGIVKITFQ